MSDQHESGVQHAAADNPFEGSELVLYSATADWVEEEPTHENLEHLGLTSWSLWARFEEDKVEIPIVGEASWHIWYSLSAETFNPDPADPVTDDFALAVTQMVDEDHGDGWGSIDEEVWDAMPDLEKYLVQLVREGFLRGGAAEPAMVVDWCVRNASEVPN